MSKGNTILSILTLVLALMLTILPLPHWAAPFRPEWALLVLIFWITASGGSTGLITIWLTGLALDILTDSKLGQHAFSLTITCYLTIRIYRQFESYPLRKQSLVIGMFTVLYLGINLWILGLQGKAPWSLVYWGPVISNMVLWPWIFVILREFRRNLLHQSR